MCGEEPLGILGCTLEYISVTSMMDCQIWYQLTGFIGGGFKKHTMVSDHIDARHFSVSLYATVAFQAATPVLELIENESE